MNRMNPGRLKEIRLMRGLTLNQVATELNISKQAVSKYERGLSQPTADAIHKMLSFFGIPSSYLTKEDIPEDWFQSPLFFRTKKSTKQTEKDIAAIHVKWVYEMLAQTGTEQLKSEVHLPSYPAHMSIEDKASELRKDWKLGLGPIDNITDVMEYNGINILGVNTSKVICDAYSQVINHIPIVIYNQDIGSGVRRRFNLAHELGHLVLHTGVDWKHLESDEAFDEIEKEANLFAESFLMPEASFARCVVSDKLDYFAVLKREWKVSVAAMIYRCGRLQVIGQDRIIQLQKQLSKRGWKFTEPLDDELEYEKPRRISLRIQSAIPDRIGADQYLTNVCLSIADMENLLGLDEGHFAAMGLMNTQYMSDGGYQQLSLF